MNIVHSYHAFNNFFLILKNPHLLNIILNYCRLLLNHGNGDYYDFQNFFDLFLETQVCNLRECLLEWLFRSRISLSSSKINANSLTADLKLPGIPFNEVENWVNVELTSLVDNVNVSGTLPFDETIPDPVVYTDADSIIDLITLLPGENILSLDKMRWCVQATKTTDTVPQPCPGCLVITTYRVILLSPRKLGARSIALHNNQISNEYKTNNDQIGNRLKKKNKEAEKKTLRQHSRYGISRYFSMTSVPLSAIFRANIAQTRNTFFIVSKDFRVIRIVLSCAIASNHCPAVSGRNINDGTCVGTDHVGVTPSTSNPSSLSSPSNPPSHIPSHSSSSSSSSATISLSNGVGFTNNITVSGLDNNNKDNLNIDDKKNDAHNRNSGNEIINRENNNKMLFDENNATTHANQSAHAHGHGYGQGQREGNNYKIVDHSSYSTNKTTDTHNNTINRNQNNNNNNNYHNNNHNYNNSNTVNNNHNKSSNHSISNSSSSTNSSHQRNNDALNNNSNHISSSSSRAENLIITLHRLAFYLSAKIALKPFAYHYRKQFEHDGWQYCDLMGEYRRQGLLNHPEWKVYIYIYMYKCACLCVCVCIYMYVCVCICMCVNICVYVCMHIRLLKYPFVFFCFSAYTYLHFILLQY